MVSRKSNSDDVKLSALAGEIRIVLGALNRRLREQADSADLTANQKSVLLRLERDGPMTASALARAEAMKPQSMSAILSALSLLGLIEGAPDPSDGRQTLYGLTAHFHTWVDSARAARKDWLMRTLQARLDAAEQQQLADGLALFKRLSDE